MAVEIHDVARSDRDPRALLVIRRLAVRNDHVQAVHGAALEETNENRAGGGAARPAGRKGGPGEE